MQLNECINFVLTQAQNSTLSYFKNHLLKYDVTPAQYAILKCLSEQGEQSPSQLAQMLHLDNSTITGIVDRMVKKDLLQRIPDTYDRRVLTIRIAPLGMSLMPEIEQTIEIANQKILSIFENEEVESLMKSLDVIAKHVKTVDQEIDKES